MYAYDVCTYYIETGRQIMVFLYESLQYKFACENTYWPAYSRRKIYWRKESERQILVSINLFIFAVQDYEWKYLLTSVQQKKELRDIEEKRQGDRYFDVNIWIFAVQVRVWKHLLTTRYCPRPAYSRSTATSQVHPSIPPGTKVITQLF